MIPEKDWIWRGLPGHFILSKNCLFHLHTRVGQYRISTVGALYLNGELEMLEVGAGRHYETMVFVEGDDGEPETYSEIDCDGLMKRPFMNPEECDMIAAKMHLEMCRKYARMED